MKPCDTLRTHFSALLDGELEPLESIGVRRHIEQCATCGAEFEALEQLKLQVHVAGTAPVLPEALRARFGDAVAARAAARRERDAWRMPLAVAAAILCGLMLTSLPGQDERAADQAVAAAEQAVVVDAAALERLVAVHHGEVGPRGLDDLVRAGALMAFERLPGSFLGPEGGRAAVVQTSYVDCDGGASGASLAVLRAARTDLPAAVQAALDTHGVFVEVVRGTEVRLSVGGDKVFVLLSEVVEVPAATSI
jgi:hypothetical protein